MSITFEDINTFASLAESVRAAAIGAQHKREALNAAEKAWNEAEDRLGQKRAELDSFIRKATLTSFDSFHGTFS